MSVEEVENLKKRLREALPEISDRELRQDMWPTMAERLAEPSFRVPWWDWALLAGTGLLLWLFPGIIPTLLYHL